MNVLEMIREGAVLTAAVEAGARMLLAPHAIIRSGRLVFYDLGSGRARSLKFDAFEWAETGDVWLIQAGDRVARLASVWRDSPEAGTAWRRCWLELPDGDRERQLAEIRARLDALEL